MEDILSPTNEVPVEDALTGQTPMMEEEIPGQEQPASPDELVLEEEIEEEIYVPCGSRIAIIHRKRLNLHFCSRGTRHS